MSSLSLGLPEPLFGGPAPRLRAIPASEPFLDLLAEAMIAALKRDDDPFALADALVLLPNRRSARGLIDAFAHRLGGAALLPTIRPLGDPHADDDPDIWGADPISGDILPPIDKMQRRMQLASLIRRRDKVENGVDDPARAIALAGFALHGAEDDQIGSLRKFRQCQGPHLGGKQWQPREAQDRTPPQKLSKIHAAQ